MPAFGGGGIAFGASGKLYVALFAKYQLSILDSDGAEELRFPSPEENAAREIPINGSFGLVSRPGNSQHDLGRPRGAWLRCSSSQ